MLDIALTVARVYVGGFFVLAGIRKWVATSEPWAGMCRDLHLPPWFRVLFPFGQVFGGAFLALGLLTAWSAVFIGVTMVGAFALWHCPRTCREYPQCWTAGRWVNLGMSVELAYVLICALILGAGPGPWSLDAWWVGHVS